MDCKGKSRETPGDLIFKVSVVISCLHRPIVKNCQVPQPKRRASAPKRTSLPRVFVVTATATKMLRRSPTRLPGRSKIWRSTLLARGSWRQFVDTPKSWRRHYPPLCVFRLWLSVIARRKGGLRHASGPELSRAGTTNCVCVTSVSITVETRPCSGCGTDLTAPALATPTPNGESWWCEACVRRTLQAIEESRQAPENEA